MKYKKNKGTPNSNISLSLGITPSPLVPHMEGKRNRKVAIVRIPEGTDITKRDLALQRVQELIQKHKGYHKR